MINQELINFTNYLADLSEAIIRQYFRKEFVEENKTNNTPVTLADKAAEGLIRNEIKKKFPDHGIIGEEFGDTNPDSDYQWVIDPIDGTISFIIGRPIFGTMIALLYKKQPIIGLINQPINKERWIGINDGAAFFNNQKIQTRKCEDLSSAILCSTSPAYFEGISQKIIKAISSKTKYQNQKGIIYGGDCYLYGLLAMGLVDIVMEYGLKNHDFIALIPLIESAGGVITDWQGRKLELENKPDFKGDILACGDKNLHQKLIKEVKKFSKS